MATDKHQKLFERLYDKTNHGELKWQETVEKGSFVVSFADYSIEVSQEFPQDGHPPVIYLTIRNAEGLTIEVVSDAEVGTLFANNAERKAFFRKTESLFELARRAALGADKALDSILKELGDDIPF